MPPTVIQVNSPDITTWLADRIDELRAQLCQVGAVVMRGVDLSDLRQFRVLVSQLCAPLMPSNGEHVALDAKGDVQTPVEFSSTKKLMWHHENTFNLTWPTRLLFGCAIAAEQGGDTPTVDGREILAALSPRMRSRFAAEGITYIRRLGLDVGLDWRTVYGTDDRVKVEQLCRATGTTLEWSSDGEKLTTWQTRPVIVRHPHTKEMTWVGQPLHWHPAALPGSLRHDLELLYGRKALPRDCVLGSGDEIPDEVVEALMDSCAELEETVRWEVGDVMWVDNLLRAHGREPYRGDRKLLVALGAPVDCRLLDRGVAA